MATPLSANNWQNLPPDLWVKIASFLDVVSAARLLVVSKGLRGNLTFIDTPTQALVYDLRSFDERESRSRVSLTRARSLFDFRSRAGAARVCEKMWIRFESNGLTNVAAASVLTVAKAAFREVRERDPDKVPWVGWLMAWLSRYASELDDLLVNFLRSVQHLFKVKAISSPAPLSIFAQLETDFLHSVFDIERAYLTENHYFICSTFNDVMASSATLATVLGEAVAKGLDLISVPPQVRRRSVPWHLFLCDLGSLCRWYMAVFRTTEPLKEGIHSALMRCVEVSRESDDQALARAHAFHGVEICHFACVYGIYFDVQRFLPMILRENRKSSQRCKRFITEWVMRTENADPRAPGQILLSEFPRVLDEILEWI